MKDLKIFNNYKLYAMITVIFWSSAYPLTKIALLGFSPTVIGLIRYGISSICLLIIGGNKLKGLKLKDVPLFLFSGASGFGLCLIAFNIGSKYVTSATSSILIALSPIISAILSSFVFKEKIKLKSWFFIFLSFLGIVIMTLWNGVFSINIGIFWLLLSALFLAIYNVTQRECIKRYSVFQSTAYSIIGGTIVLSYFLPKTLTEAKNVQIEYWIIMLYLGIFPSVISYFCWGKALSLAKSTSEVTNFMFLTPILASILGTFLLNELPTIEIYLGGGLVLLGIILFNKCK